MSKSEAGGRWRYLREIDKEINPDIYAIYIEYMCVCESMCIDFYIYKREKQKVRGRERYKKKIYIYTRSGREMCLEYIYLYIYFSARENTESLVSQ